jgi:hypothetical protein
MNNFFKYSMSSAIAVVIFTGCGGNKLDVMSYPKQIK